MASVLRSSFSCSFANSSEGVGTSVRDSPLTKEATNMEAFQHELSSSLKRNFGLIVESIMKCQSVVVFLCFVLLTENVRLRLLLHLKINDENTLLMKSCRESSEILNAVHFPSCVYDLMFRRCYVMTAAVVLKTKFRSVLVWPRAAALNWQADKRSGRQITSRVYELERVYAHCSDSTARTKATRPSQTFQIILPRTHSSNSEGNVLFVR